MTLTELDKFTTFFVKKAVQVVVQSRLGLDKISSKSNPEGKDIFNLSITDLKEVTDATVKCLELIANQEDINNSNKRFTVTRSWKVCCEISLKSDEGDSLVLESWLISNDVLPPQSDLRQVPEEIYNVYNRMGLLLKSMVSLSRATPAYKISQSGQSADTYIICYRIFPVFVKDVSRSGSPTSSPTKLPTGFDEDENTRNKRYSKPFTLGSISSQYSCLSASFVYRTSLEKSTEQSSTTAVTNPSPVPMPVPSSKVTSNIQEDTDELDGTSDPLKNRKIPAFASPTSRRKNQQEKENDPSLHLIPENPFMSLLMSVTQEEKKGDRLSSSERTTANIKKRDAEHHASLSLDKERKETTSDKLKNIVSSEESFVFVEAPFASDESKVLGSFFNGPTPSFNEDSQDKILSHLSDLSAEIEALESAVPQWDSFVESICLDQSESDELHSKQHESATSASST